MRNFLLGLSLVLCFISGNAVSVYPSSIIGSGCSISTIGYLSELVKEYEKKTGAKVFVRGDGSVVGLEDLHNGRVDFATSCRNSRSKEKGRIIRGTTLSQALSKAAEEGLINEDLDLIKKASYIITAPDVLMVQVFFKPMGCYRRLSL